MPRLHKSTLLAGALVCAAMLAQSFAPSLVRRTAAAAGGSPQSAARDVTAPPGARPTLYGALPLTFEVNRGQADSRAEFLSRGAGYTLALARGGATLSMDGRARAAALRLSFPGADPAARPEALGLSEAKSNYLVGRDPRRWLTGVENYERVLYAGLYPGVDLIFHGSGGRLEYDFRLGAYADARRIKVRFGGARGVRLNADGALVLRTRGGEVRQPKPVAYQEGDGRRTYVACDYVSSRPGEVGFRLGAYDRARPLVIDPVLVYSTFLGGSVTAQGVAADAAGNAYVIGNDNTGDVLVLKLNPTGTGLVYSTHVGGSGGDVGHSIALDADGNAYVTGTTTSPNFPTSADAFDKTCGNNGTCSDLGPGPQSDAFVFKLNPAGTSLVYSTYLGGSGVEPVPSQVNWPNFPRMDIALDAGGNAYVAGSTTSQDFPTTPGAFRTTPGTTFVTKLNPAGTALVYSTYFPGAIAQAVAIDSGGDAYITGITTTSDSNPPALPVVNAYQPTLGGQFTFDAFAAKLNPTGTALVFSTFLGGREGLGDTPRGGDDYGNGIGVDAAGNVYVSGTTRSGCFPAASPYTPPTNCSSGGGHKEFLVKFSPAGDTLLFSRKLTTLVSLDGELSVGASGLSTVAWTCQRTATLFDVCVSRVSTAGQALYATTFGGRGQDLVFGMAADDAGSVYVTGQTTSFDYPTTPGAWNTHEGGTFDSFATKLSTALPEVQFETGRVNSSLANYDVNEGGGKVTVRVERSGDLASDFTVDYATSDGTAKSTSDYTAASGTLHFAPFETTKTFEVFITDDAYGPEGVETFTVTLSNPTGGALLGANAAASVNIADNDSTNGQNPVVWPGMNGDFFVRQHYIDFLNREPDSSGYDFWRSQLFNCGINPACVEVRRVNVSAAFFLSIEFQETGYFVERMYKTAYGDAASPNVPGTVPVVRLNEFLPDTRRVGAGLVVGQTGWQSLLDANQSAYALEFVQRPRFLAVYPASLGAAQFVDKLDQNAGGVLSAEERAQLVAVLRPAPADATLRAAVLRKVADDADLRRREFNRAFVLMQYFGYLRRDPDAAPDADFRGWKFWLDKLNQFNGDWRGAEMVRAFLDSAEYRHRFGA
jgi:hypothetical protein